MSDKSLPENAGSPAAGVQPSSFGRRKSNLADASKRRAADEVGSPGVDQRPAANPLPPTEGADVKIEELAALAAGVGAERPESRRQGAADTGIIVTTTNSVEGHRISEYLGLVSGEAILGANLFKDMFASITDIVGGRSGSYEMELGKARGIAVQDMIDSAMFRDADAIVGVDIDYEVLSMRGSMLMVMANGTAVKLAPDG